ncbi:hypothetical protein [Bacillus salipaludis]|uniref:DUF4047 domain-containing protein n=1 Tax=Bacillus salipaludis TaxID=2547811 RepID=A0ABW8RJ61_9BACI
MRRKHFLLIIVICLLTTGIAYAETNTNYQIKSWFENKVAEAKSSISISMLSLVKSHISSLLKNNSQITASADGLEVVSISEKEKTKNAIQKKLKEYETQLDQAVSAIKNQSPDQKAGIINKINTQTTQTMNSIDLELEDVLKNVSSEEDVMMKSDHNEKHLRSADKLKQQISVTKLVISDFQLAHEKETNPVIKDYIESKIDFLNEMVALLEN